MRVVGILAGVVVVWMSAAGHVVGGWEKSKLGIGVGLAIAAALVLGCIPKGFRRAALVLGALVVVVCAYAAWAG